MLELKRLAAAAAAALIVLAAAPVVAKEWKTVRIGTEGAYPPFNSVDTAGNLVGFDIDIAKALCAEMKVECTFVAQDWDGIIPALLAGKYDAIVASMSITEERKKRVDFTDKYYQTPARFVAAKGAGFGNAPKELAGKTLGAQRATTHASYLEDNYKDSDIRLYATQDEANLDLQSGRLDAILADSVVLYDWMQADGKDCCAFIGEPIIAPQWFGEGVGIALRQDDDDLREKFNAAIAKILADGTYRKINDSYFPFSVY